MLVLIYNKKHLRPYTVPSQRSYLIDVKHIKKNGRKRDRCLTASAASACRALETAPARVWLWAYMVHSWCIPYRSLSLAARLECSSALIKLPPCPYA